METRHKTPYRTAAYMVAIERVVQSLKLRGVYAERDLAFRAECGNHYRALLAVLRWRRVHGSEDPTIYSISLLSSIFRPSGDTLYCASGLRVLY